MNENPKTKPTDNAEKDPQDWVTGDEPMTGAQASYLKTLCEQAGQPEAYDEALTKAQASERIDTLKLVRKKVKNNERLMEPKN